MRFTIRIKIMIMSVISIAVAVATLGVFLTISFSNSAFQSAANTLESVSSNATLALQNSITSAETSINLLTNQIGFNYKFANAILTADEEQSNKELREAMNGENGLGDGSSIIGAMDYLIVSDADIKSATMFSWFITDSINDRLCPVTDSKIPYNEEKKAMLLEHPGRSYWYFVSEGGVDYLYVWKAIVNYGVEDLDDMQVVGYMEYGFDRASFLACISDTKYENEGMLLYDENDQLVLQISCDIESIDEKVLSSVASFENGTKKHSSFTVTKTNVGTKEWTYITFINHRSIEKTNQQSRNLTILIVSVSVVAAALVAYILAAREIKRIRKLSKAAGEISNGNYDVRLTKSANDEITDVGESFNVMAGKVQDALQELILQQDSISENFATILSNKSGESGNHVKRVSEYSAVLAQEMGFNENEVHDIRIASMLHDVGKIMIDESILHKPGRFTDEEYKIMQQHVVYGGKLLQGVPGNIMQLGAIIALYHHERWDGNGYVHHLVGDEIPKEAQITSVADVFDALVSKRCYKGAWTIDDAFNEIVSQSGKQFSPVAVEAFKRRFEDFKRIATEYKDEE